MGAQQNEEVKILFRIATQSQSQSVCNPSTQSCQILQSIYLSLLEKETYGTLHVKKTSITPPCLVSGRVVEGRQQTGQVPLAGVVSHQHPVAQPAHSTVDNEHILLLFGEKVLWRDCCQFSISV